MPTIEELNLENISPLPPATPEMVEQLEEKLGLKLPYSYRKLLMTYNGGHTRFNCFNLSDGEWGSSFNQLYGITLDDEDSYGIVRGTTVLRQFIEEYREEIAEYSERVPEPAQVIAIADNGGGDDIFLDYATSPPSVKIMYRDPIVARDIAPSFDAFVESLFEDDEEQD